jgi:MoaA/NifB/PqqE/SkfB family radical SAM enzyme
MPANLTAILSTVARNPRLLRAKPSVNLFLASYMRKFKIRRIGGQTILHSHLPPLNSRAYARFIDEHLLGGNDGPSHAQIGVTNACPQRCAYCYNRDRQGHPMDLETILQTIRGLKAMGVFWIGLTGGEPLLNPHLTKIIAEAAPDAAVKLFTTGCGLTPAMAGELKKSGLFSVSVSLDHWTADIHDQARQYPGAFQTALRAIDIFKNADLDVGVSAVLSREMIRTGGTETFLEFLGGLGIQEAWLSETKPSVPALWRDEFVISETERRALIELQDRLNRNDGPTVNYLGHFESAEHFGCNAGRKFIYVDAFGDVSPCVFAPLTFGNVRERDVRAVWDGMRPLFSADSECFINKFHKTIARHSSGRLPLSPEASRSMMKDVVFGPPGRFLRLLQGQRRTSP